MAGTREKKTPAERAAAIRASLTNVNLKIEELNAAKAKLDVQLKRLEHNHPELVDDEG